MSVTVAGAAPVSVTVLDVADLAASLAAAQAALVAAAPGTAHEWRVPAPAGGAAVATAAVVLGAPGRSLALVGTGQPLLRVTAGAAPAGLHLVGADVQLRGVDVDVDGGAVTGVRLEAQGVARLVDCTVTVRGQEAVGVRLAAGAAAEAVGVTVTQVRATLGTATGLDAEAPDVRLHRVRVGPVSARELAVGVRAAAPRGQGAAGAGGTGGAGGAAGAGGAGGAGAGAGPGATVTLSFAEVADVAGSDAAGVVAVTDATGVLVDAADAAGAPGAPTGPVADPESAGPSADVLTLLDVRVRQVRARGTGGWCVGAGVACAGALDARGLTIEDVQGSRAVGVHALVAGAAVVSGATVRAVAGGPAPGGGGAGGGGAGGGGAGGGGAGGGAGGGGAGGAAGAARGPGAVGLELVASASREPLSLDDVHVEQVHAPALAGAVGGVLVQADVSELAPWVDDDTDPGALLVTGCAVRRVSGTAVAVDAALRDVELRGVEVFGADRGALLSGERVLVTETTWHRLRRGPEVGPCALVLVNSLVTGVAEGPALALSSQAEVRTVEAVFADPADPAPLLAALPGGSLPYRDPGPAGLPDAFAEGRFVPEAAVDLRLAGDSPLLGRAVRTPGDPPDRAAHVGAHPPTAPVPCDLRDPLVVEEPGPEPRPVPGPVLDRLARDGRGLLRVMQTRAAVALPGWVPGDPADLTTTLLERLAHELDRVSYAQDAALAEAALPSARLRRSVEEHARLVDYEPDPGLSATTMLQVDVVDPAALGLTAPESARVAPFVVGRDTVVVNPDAAEDPVVVSTEEDLQWHSSLASVELAEDVAAGQHHALLAGDLLDLQPGRWLVLRPADRAAAPHVVRVTLVELGTDTTLVWWDPRRPAPRRFDAGATRVLGNVVPAHQGLRVGPAWSPALADPGLREQVADLAAALDVVAAARSGESLEVPLPLAPVSRVAPGWPFPGEPPRTGQAEVAVAVDGEPWRLVPDVAAEPGEVFMVAPHPGGGSVVVLGQPGALPARPVGVRIEARLGIGAVGNIGARTLTSLVALGPTSSTVPADLGLDGLRRALLVDNPVPGVGGRDPEPLERIRRRAPWAARQSATAVTAGDYVRLLERLPEVAAARARVLELGERRVVRTTLLLRDEDTLVAGGPDPSPVDRLDPVRDAERVRRWSLARRRLEEIRLLGFDVELAPPTFVPVDLDVVVDAQPWARAEQVRLDVTAALAADGGLFDPDHLGLGGDVHVDAVLRRALAVDGVGAARVRRLRRLRAGSPEHAVEGTLPIGDEEVAVLRRPYGDGPDGLLTVEVCGGVR